MHSNRQGKGTKLYLSLTLLLNVDDQHVENGSQVGIRLQHIDVRVVFVFVLAELDELRVAELGSQEDDSVVHVGHVVHYGRFAQRLELESNAKPILSLGVTKSWL